MLRSSRVKQKNYSSKFLTWPGFKWVKRGLQLIVTLLLIVGGNYYLQLAQHQWSKELAVSYIENWQSQIFWLNCIVLFIFWLFWYGLSGSWLFSTIFYTVVIGVAGYANNEKLIQRLEPIYPNELAMLRELGLMKEMIGTGPFLICILLILIALGGMVYAIYRSFSMKRSQQIIRLICLGLTIVAFIHMSNFNKPGNFLRQQYDKTAQWISYSQKNNYRRVGLVGGFLYNFKVAAMEKPKDYSEAAVKEVVERYQGDIQKETEEMPNIVFVMGESFSDPLRLNGIEAERDPLAVYRDLANQTYSGQMLSSNYGGGTANVEFEALTSFSMEPLSPQMTIPYSMLVPKITNFPSVVSLLKNQDYTATAIHPHNTSMYKRDTVYKNFGFDEFISINEMTHTDKLENNPYVSDASAYADVLDILNEKGPQFVHLVTMQSHNPYDKKYPEADYGISEIENLIYATNYFQDMEYSSQALADFIKELNTLERRTLVVYWGDHLPGFYGQDILGGNEEISHYITEFLMYDTEPGLHPSEKVDNILSPVFFSSELFKQAALAQPGFYKLLGELETLLPAFKDEHYLIDDAWQSERNLSAEGQAVYADYALIQYDIVAGKQYSLKAGFFDTVKK